ncbi:hypothetical protein CDD81_4076 [Ophiocordyceps australis]|uniref:Uncharacterized protein n=1 Tax=Ophiocordyceps australis TaxID=1399860 RepID=A0A2C5XR65_9HYPO|nr:hypothetical protein CDD81_4076 [Ophiocordyceps australis]
MAPTIEEQARQLVKRREHDASHGVLDPHDMNNVGFFVLFALIGVGFVLTGIWFFFWAKNGGFHFGKKDWDDYKSTVLRRKGPNGTLLSGATATTDLGGGSVYKDVMDGDDASRTVVTESTTALSGITAGASDIAARKKRKEKQERRRRDREQRMRRRGESSAGTDRERERDRGKRRVANNGGVLDEEAEKQAQKELRNYRHEKPARVGGLNKQSEGSNPSEAATSDLLTNRQSTPTRKSSSSQAKIRKVHSTTTATTGPTEREAERIRSEARRLRDESRSRDRERGRVLRRDFSYQRPGGAEKLSSSHA